MDPSVNNDATRSSFTKTLIIFLGLTIGFIGIFLWVYQCWMNDFYRQVDAQHRQNLIQLVSLAKNSIDPILHEVRSGSLSPENAKIKVRDIIHRMTYEDEYGKNYIFMSDYNGVMWVQPFEPAMEMTNQIGLKDARGFPIIQGLIQAAKSHPQGSFVEYVYHLPGVHEDQNKMAYVIGLTELNCYIGTGMYMLKSIQEQKAILKKVKYGSVLLSLMMATPVVILVFMVYRRNRMLKKEILIRRQIETALGNSEEKYRRIVETAAEGIWAMNENFCTTFVNARLATLLGYEVDEMIGQPVSSFMYLDDLSDHERLMDLRKKGVDSRYERRFRRRDGGELWTMVSAKAIRDKDERFIGSIAMLTDITEQKRAFDALRESERRFQTLIRNLPGMVYRCQNQPDWPMEYVSEGSLELTGYKPEEITIGGTIDYGHIIHPDDRERVFETIKLCVQNCRFFQLEYRIITKNGNVKWVWEHGQAILSPRQDNVLLEGFITNITERKQAVEALQESEERFRTILDSVPNVAVQGFWPDGTIHYWNKANQLFYGYSARETIGKNIVELLVPPAMREAFRHTIQQMDDAGIPIPPSENTLLRNDGTSISVYSNHAILNIAGRKKEFYRIDVDLTPLKRLEEQRLELERRLLHAQKLESLGVLAGGIAHDFNNLLMAISGNLNLAQIDLPTTSPAQSPIQNALKATHRAADLTQQMLAYSGKGKFLIEELNLSALVQEMAHLLQITISKSIQLILQLHDPLPLISADPAQIQQILMNLVVNASEAIGDRMGSITLITNSGVFDENYLRNSRLEEKPAPGRFVYLEVVDTGCGMDADTLRRLFDPFFTTKFQGRGLGMSAVLGIVRSHQGAITIESEMGRGTAYRILFPALETTAANISNDELSLDPMKAASESSMSGLVLVADDEEMVLKLCESILQYFGFQVEQAIDGEEALAKFRAHPHEFVCAILDLTMPKLDGVAVFEEMRKIRPDFKAILSSGYSQYDISQRFAGSGLSGFIQKPYQFDELKSELKRILQIAS